MKKILIGLTLLASMSSFGETREQCNDRIDYSVTMRALLYTSGLEVEEFKRIYNIDTSESFIRGVKDLRVTSLAKVIIDSPHNDTPLGASRAFTNYLYVRGQIENGQQNELLDTFIAHSETTTSTVETLVNDLRDRNILTPVKSDASCREASL